MKKIDLNSIHFESDIKKLHSPKLLQELHILTKELKINQDSKRKIKQIHHLMGFLKSFISEWMDKEESFTLIDMGAGKSYLGFILYDFFLKDSSKGNVISVESREELIKNSLKIQKESSFERMSFLALTIRDAIHSLEIPSPIHLLTALHACDTATDDAIDFGLSRNAKVMALIPCCQATLAKALNASQSQNESFNVLWKHPHHAREFGSHLTNVLRCLKLEASGYHVTVTELVGFEHSLKNELILATKKGDPLPEKVEKLNQFLSSLPISDQEKKRYQV